MTPMRSTLALLSLLFLCAQSAQAQWKPDTPLVLKGKIVSMDGKSVRSGQVVIRNGLIEAILTASAAPPAGALVVDSKGYIYPGLMNLHNHMKYNVVGLYDVPKHYENRDEWPTGKAYSKYVNNPSVVVTSSELFGRLDEALKFSEVRSIVGGETSTQGAEDNPAIKTTLVRNVELPNFGEDVIGQRTFSIDKLFWEHLPEQIAGIKAQRAWLFHLCEGIDPYSRLEWSDPSWDPAKPFSMSKSARNRPGVVQANMVWPGLVGVHCTAMHEEDFREWKQIAGGPPKLVWSPTSNLLLYGKTTDIRGAIRQGAIVALGTDWSPSGTKNLLWELKVVDQLNQKSAPKMFRSDKDIVALATVNAAKILGWENKVGQIKVGMAADLIVVDDTKKTTSGYRNLLLATEEHIQLVLVDGNPLYGDEKHLEKLKVYAGKKQYERIPETPDARPKAIDMLQDPKVRNGDISLAETRRRLEQALRLDAQALADIVNAGVKESATRTTYKARDAMKADLVKLLTRGNKPVPPELNDPKAPVTAEHVRTFLALKYPHLEPTPALETLYTDERFLAGMENNLHLKGAGILDLRKYKPFVPGAAPGLSGSLPGQ